MTSEIKIIKTAKIAIKTSFRFNNEFDSFYDFYTNFLFYSTLVSFLPFSSITSCGKTSIKITYSKNKLTP